MSLRFGLHNAYVCFKHVYIYKDMIPKLGISNFLEFFMVFNCHLCEKKCLCMHIRVHNLQDKMFIVCAMWPTGLLRNCDLKNFPNYNDNVILHYNMIKSPDVGLSLSSVLFSLLRFFVWV